MKGVPPVNNERERSMSRQKKGSNEQIKTRTDSTGQIELTVGDTPLYKASERLVMAKAQINHANKELEDAEDNWVDEMKKAKKGKINHKGDIIQFVMGRTSKDHARFCKS